MLRYFDVSDFTSKRRRAAAGKTWRIFSWLSDSRQSPALRSLRQSMTLKFWFTLLFVTAAVVGATIMRAASAEPQSSAIQSAIFATDTNAGADIKTNVPGAAAVV